MRRLCVGRPPAKSNFFLSFENFFLPSALLPYPATMLEFYISLFFIENPPDVFIFLHQGDFLYCPFLTDLFSARRRLCSIELPNVNSIHRFRFLSIAGVAPTSALCATQLKQGKQADSSTSGILMRKVYTRSKVLRSPLQTHLWTVILSSSNMR